MSLFQRIFGETKQRAPLQPLYRAVVAKGRDPAWYRDGQVPDTIDGRFDMVAAILSLVLLRLEHEGEAARDQSVLLTEIFIEDMDGTLRQIGIGDYVVGKHVGRMMSALGGRLGALREARAAGALDEAVTRNIFHEAPPSPEAVAFVAAGLARFADALDATPTDSILAGTLP
ncbi:MAG TPA: ubiquinol-cytochrome C chaperone family protein [Allosphingosinicella sp.]|nr:ubiquinol-cytochrome C chaperone family protein [Allosphingosinicella sp.]